MTNQEKIILARTIAAASVSQENEEYAAAELLKVYLNSVRAEVPEPKKRGRISAKQQVGYTEAVAESSEKIGSSVAVKAESSAVELSRGVTAATIDIIGFSGQVDVNSPNDTDILKSTERLKVNGLGSEEWFSGVLPSTLRDLFKRIGLGEFVDLTGAALERKILRESTGRKAQGRFIDIAASWLRFASTAAIYAVYMANPKLVKGVQWSSVREVETCDRCFVLDGQRWGLTEKKPPMPVHMFCQCWWIPMMINMPNVNLDRFLNWISNGEYYESQGHVNSRRFFWDLSKDEQKKILGPGRMNLVRGHKIKLDDLVRRSDGRKLTLDELKAK